MPATAKRHREPTGTPVADRAIKDARDTGRAVAAACGLRELTSYKYVCYGDGHTRG